MFAGVTNEELVHVLSQDIMYRMGWKRPKHEMIGSDPVGHHRRSIRLPGYDYTQAGLYFVTVVTWQRECLLGVIEAGQVMLSPVGQVVHREWKRLMSRFPDVGLDEFVIMPNHVHGIQDNPAQWEKDRENPVQNPR